MYVILTSNTAVIIVELTHGEPVIKRKFEESPISVSQEEKTSTDSAGQREDNEGTSSEGTTDVDSTTTSTDTEASHQQLTEVVIVIEI